VRIHLLEAVGDVDVPTAEADTRRLIGDEVERIHRHPVARTDAVPRTLRNGQQPLESGQNVDARQVLTQGNKPIRTDQYAHQHRGETNGDCDDDLTAQFQLNQEQQYECRGQSEDGSF